MSESFDVAIVGGGPGGYVAAIRAAQLGMKVAIVEKREALGGTCLIEGCIPSKALLESSELYHTVGHGLAEHGIAASGVGLDVAAMMARKTKVVGELTRGLDVLMKKNKITRLVGTGRLEGGGKVRVEGANAQTLAAKHIIIATGSEPIELPGMAYDGQTVIHSTHALALERVPEHLIVVGAGVIGLELGSVWLRLGAKVTVVELLPGLLHGIDAQTARLAQRAFAKQGMVFHFGAKVGGVEVKGGRAAVSVTPAQGDPFTLEGDKLLVAVGRKPYTGGLGLEQAGVALDERGRVKVDAHFATSAAGVYAIGDVIAGPMLAHKAEEEGVALAEKLAGHEAVVNYDAIPYIVYTHPEIAWVGQGEDQLKAQGRDYKVGTFPFMANGRAKALGATEGHVKLLADAHDDTLLGAMIFGPRASDLIHEASLCIEFGGSAEDIALAVHAHPTLAEAVKEAALALHKRSIHL